MDDNRYFKEALSSFTADAAYADAVRRLHDTGMGVAEIKKNLLVSVSEETIEKVIQDYEARKNSPDSEYIYIRETDGYGRRSFRRVKKEDNAV